MTDIERIATAFSTHAFAETYDAMADDVTWENVGGETYAGRDAVVAACDGALAWFATITETRHRLDVIAGDAAVAVDTLTTYREADGGESTVASCDLYWFTGGRLTRIRSYTTEVPAPADR